MAVKLVSSPLSLLVRLSLVGMMGAACTGPGPSGSNNPSSGTGGRSSPGAGGNITAPGAGGAGAGGQTPGGGGSPTTPGNGGQSGGTGGAQGNPDSGTPPGGDGGVTPPVNACAGGSLMPGNRCTPAIAGVTKGMGNEPMIDDFEPAAGSPVECQKIRAVDGRSGIWNSGKDTMSPMGSVVHKVEAPGDGAAPGSTRALHVVGTGLNDWGGFLATPLAPCYDASAYKGISFWLKGDPSKAPYIKVSVITPHSAQAAEGGSCVQGTGAGQECYDHFSVHLFKVSNIWTRYAITWQQLAQYGWGRKIPATVRPEAEIIGINFSPDWPNVKTPNKGFDFWVDNLTFEVDAPYADTGFKQTIDKAKFDAAFAMYRNGQPVNPLYAKAYDDLAEALNDPRFSRIGREGTAEDRKREIAAFMAHIVQESGSLLYHRELAPAHIYCDDAKYPAYKCAPGKTYIGRGPMQLSWNYNYGAASTYFGLGNSLLTNPERVENEGPLSWKAALFFWIAGKNPDANYLLVGPHTRFLKEGFGASIRAINGALECGPGDPRANNRKNYYQNFCTRIGVTGCNVNLDCPAQ